MRKFLPLREDLSIHRIAGATIGFLIVSGLLLSGRSAPTEAFVHGVCVASAFGWLNELYQALCTDDRQPDQADALVTCAGGVEGSALAALIMKLIAL